MAFWTFPLILGIGIVGGIIGIVGLAVAISLSEDDKQVKEKPRSEQKHALVKRPVNNSEEVPKLWIKLACGHENELSYLEKKLSSGIHKECGYCGENISEGDIEKLDPKVSIRITLECKHPFVLSDLEERLSRQYGEVRCCPYKNCNKPIGQKDLDKLQQESERIKLTCQHVFVYSDLEEHVNREEEQGYSPACPICEMCLTEKLSQRVKLDCNHSFTKDVLRAQLILQSLKLFSQRVCPYAGCNKPIKKSIILSLNQTKKEK